MSFDMNSDRFTIISESCTKLITFTGAMNGPQAITKSCLIPTSDPLRGFIGCCPFHACLCKFYSPESAIFIILRLYKARKDRTITDADAARDELVTDPPGLR
jgi:hypothetical protein